MIIDKISIKKFRGFKDVKFSLGNLLTVIAGQNGTQKTTLLGMLSQSFSITDKENPLRGEKPLSGGTFKSAFASKFKLSKKFDKPKTHEWTLFLHDYEDFTLESIPRGEDIRFWKKKDHSKGSGYVQLPVIYLSLSRLLPIGEDDNINSTKDVVLSQKEFEFYNEWHNDILLIPDIELTAVDYLASKQKNTIGANTEFYDWKMNSAGQDNIGKILLAILSFKRLQEKYKKDYKGGILAIDEIDATLFPASQIKLIKALRKFASKYKIQIIFTTHSLSTLKQACEYHFDKKCPEQTKVIYLERADQNIDVTEDLTFEDIKQRLNVSFNSIVSPKKLPVFTEDEEGAIFLKALLKRKTSDLDLFNCNLSCSALIDLATRKFPGFKFPDSLIVLDGDVKNQKQDLRKISKVSNILLLPGEQSPERILATFLHGLSDKSPIWKNIKKGYTKQMCFCDFSLRSILNSRNKAKEWFRSQSKHWGRNCTKVINPWMKENQEIVDVFVDDFLKIQSQFDKALNNSIV